MKVLGFWEKLFKKCVAAEDYQTLSDTVEKTNKSIALKEQVISDLKDELGNKEQSIQNLTVDKEAESKLNAELTERNTELLNKVNSVNSQLETEKDKHAVTLTLLKGAQDEIESLKNQPVEVAKDEDCKCEEQFAEDDSAPITDDGVVGDGIFEKEDVLKGADVVVTSADKLQNFVNGLSRVEMRELKDDILKGHSNDKRLTGTLKNWVKKFPDKLETQVYFMFKTALNRRRAKQRLAPWYDKYDALN